jgi:chloramphenicol 3-O-phosphotransferase
MNGLKILACIPFIIPAQPGLIVLFNGTSSAGKTSIVKELQKIHGDSCLVISSDDFIDTYLDEHPAPDDTVPQEECLEFYIKLYDSFYQHAKDRAHSGRNVFVDTIRFDDDHERYSAILDGSKLIKVLVYCPLSMIFKRVAQRNSSGGPKEQRQAFYAFDQFLYSYKLQKFEHEKVIDRIKSSDLLDALKRARLDAGEDTLNNKLVYDKLVEKFKLTTLNEVILVPEFQYDIIINSNNHTPQEIAELITRYV